jgi:outer membrane protein OmpA-like peptidoglycan-associated protein
MALPYFKAASRPTLFLLVGGLIWSLTGTPVVAQSIPANQIVNTLAPTVTRSLTAPVEPALSDKDHAFVEGLRHRTRSLSLDESDHVTELAKDRPKIDLEIYFDYGSAEISPKAEPQMKQLADALLNPRLESSVVVLGGHTDAKGGDDFNQKLSERRAEAVKEHLVTKYKLSPDNLTTAGYGKRDLKDKANPFAADNRRVQIVNLASGNQANR